jgi:DASH complex subunit ASK1
MEGILPNVEKYGEASKGILESVNVSSETVTLRHGVAQMPNRCDSCIDAVYMQFWKTFFESSAGIRLTGQPGQEEHSATVADSPAQDPISPATTQNSSYRTQSTNSSPSSTVRGTPASLAGRHPQWSNDVPLSDMLQKSLDLEETNAPPEGSHDEEEEQADVSKPSFLRRHDDFDPLDSPELVRPELETMTLGERLPPPAFSDKGKGKAKPQPSPAAQSSKDPRLLRKVLNKHGGTPSRGAPRSTPKKIPSSQFPSDIPAGWNGLADLSKTPLSSMVSPRKSRRPMGSWDVDDSADQTMSPPLLMSVNRARLTKTPGKEAAKLITRDVLRSAALRGGHRGEDWQDVGGDDSPLDPPSVVKNWKARGYGGDFDDRPTPRGEGSRRLFEEEDDDFDPPELPEVRTRSGLVREDDDDDEGDRGGGGGGRSFEVEAEEETWEDSYDQSEGDVDVSFEPVDVAEDTVFGGRRSTMGAGAAAAGRRSTVGGRTLVDEDDDDVTGSDGGDFRLKGLGPDEMHTLHGGDLLQSQPFDKSPLAGRDWRGL